MAQSMKIETLPDPEKLEAFFRMNESGEQSYVERHMKKRNVDKMALARSCSQYMTKDVMQERFDWKVAIEQIADRIVSWNHG